MAVESFAAGSYGGTYNAVGIGITRDGYHLQFEAKAETIEESDGYGASMLDYVYRGGSNYIQFEGMTYQAGTVNPFWPFGFLGQISLATGPIGQLAGNLAKTLTLTARANTTAATTGLATLSALGAILAPNYSAELLFSSRLRTVPIRMVLLPYVGSGGTADIRTFTTT